MRGVLVLKVFIIITLVLLVGIDTIHLTGGTFREKTVIINYSPPGYIQNLINNASDGDTIHIPSGIYYESIVINKSISLIGEDNESHHRKRS